MTSLLYDLPEYDDVRIPWAVMAQFAESAWQGSKDKKAWISRGREELDDGDLLFTAVSEEEDRGSTLRRITWTRWAVRDDAMITALIHLVTGKEFVDDREQVERAMAMEREVRNAILMKPPA